MGNLKKRGFLILPTILSIFIVGMLGVALSAIYGGMFSTLSAGKGASQAQQYAAVESEYVKLQGYDNADNVVHGWKTMEALTGEDDGKNWESKVTLERTKKTDSGNTVKVMKVATRKNGDLISRYSSEVPLVEGYDVYSKAEIDQMFTTLSSQISQLSSDLDAFKKATADNFTTINNNINQIKSNLDDLSKMLGTETQARIDADKAISNTISNETKARQDADKALSNQIDSLKSSLTDLQSALNTEVSNRQAADKALQSNIDSETSARKAADAAEANARKQAISDLQAQINSKYDELYNLYKGLKSRLDGNEFVKSKNGENNIALKYEQKDGEDKKTLHAYVDGVEVPLASQNADTSSDGIIKRTEELVLIFVPHYKFVYATSSGSGGTSGTPLIKADGSVIASLFHYTYVDAVFSDGCKINILTKKEVENGVYLSGGLTTGYAEVHEGSVQKSAENYIEEHLDSFKEQAFTMMPEAKNATRIYIEGPNYLSNGPVYNEFFPNNT